MTKKNPTEKDVKKEVKRMLDYYHWFWWMPPANGFGASGISDFHALKGEGVGGVFLAIETKHGNNKPTELQKGFLKSILQSGGLSMVVNEEGLPWLNVWLEAFDRSVKEQEAGKPMTDRNGAAMLDAMKKLTELMV